MNETDALRRALRALNEIDRLADDPLDPYEAVEDIHGITGDLIGELARAGFIAEPTS